MTTPTTVTQKYTMANPDVLAVQFDGTADHAEYLNKWARALCPDAEVLNGGLDSHEPSGDPFFFLVTSANPKDDVEVNKGDWLVAKKGHEDGQVRFRMWKDNNFRRTFDPKS